MDTFKQLIAQLRAIWSRWTVGQRTVIVGVGAASVLGMAALTFWASQQDFVPLANQLSPGDAHEIVSLLQSEGIAYEMNFSGSAISVPSQDLAKAKLATKQVGVMMASDADQDMGSTFPGLGGSPEEQGEKMKRGLERRIALSIQRLVDVKSATVHITQGETSLFIRDETPSKASVILDLKPGASFTGADATAVVTLVSHSVENLSPENTTIIDTAGRILSSGESLGGDVGSQLEYQQRLEMSLAAKAEAMLNPVLGYGLAIVRVAADIDFTNKTSEVTSYDQDGKAKVKEKIETEKTTGSVAQSGSAGVTSNVGNADSNSTTGGSSDRETIETDYQNSQTVDTVVQAPGRLTRLTVSAVVQLPEPEVDEDGNPVAGAVPPVTREEIEAAIKQAVGFDDQRGDQINVLATKMAAAPDFAAPIGWGTYVRDFAPLASSGALILASIVALTLGMKTIKKLKPVVVEVERSDTIDPEVRAQLADFSDEILQHPEAVSTVFTQWLEANASKPKSQQRKVA